ncbi:hypothetical protein GCM10009111_22870 [Colwellia asteriadis]|uniref:GlyGly-CTERM sorting domain-containing protein n=1 Tax=Colwellia asteriadis TaxID=517723 RepID=A0ABN1L894_9GAMM
MKSLILTPINKLLAPQVKALSLKALQLKKVGLLSISLFIGSMQIAHAINNTTADPATNSVIKISAMSQKVNVSNSVTNSVVDKDTRSAVNRSTESGNTDEARKNRFKHWLKNKNESPENSTEKRQSSLVIPAGITREEHQALISQNLVNNSVNAQQALLTKSYTDAPGVARHTVIYPENFSIYDAFSYLLEDIDGDGYYQSFSIVFDADFYPYYANSQTPQTDVYAELYLSYNGGAWSHFHSTDIFTIYSDTSADEYEVFAQLEQGYPSGSIDILIDLYHANSHQLVSSYSADDNNALYALPLESADFDQPYVTEVIYTEGGSSSGLWLFFVSLILSYRAKAFITQLTEK